MNTTTKDRTRRLLAVGTLALAATTATSTAQAAEVSRSGSAYGVRGDAAVTCTSGSARLMSATPRMGTSVGYEFGQNVAWKFTIVNVATGATVWSDPSWRTARTFTAWYMYDYYGHTTVQVKAFADLPEMNWTMRPGRYRVLTNYAWLTTKGWSQSTWRTDNYQIVKNPVGTRYDTVCSIAVY